MPLLPADIIALLAPFAPLFSRGFWRHVPSTVAGRAGSATQLSGRDLCRSLHENRLVLMQGSQRLLVQVEVRLHQLRRRQPQPLVQRDVNEPAASEQLQLAQRLLTLILHIMRHRERHVPDVACLKIKGSGMLA